MSTSSASFPSSSPTPSWATPAEPLRETQALPDEFSRNLIELLQITGQTLPFNKERAYPLSPPLWTLFVTDLNTSVKDLTKKIAQLSNQHATPAILREIDQTLNTIREDLELLFKRTPLPFLKDELDALQKAVCDLCEISSGELHLSSIREYQFCSACHLRNLWNLLRVAQLRDRPIYSQIEKLCAENPERENSELAHSKTNPYVEIVLAEVAEPEEEQNGLKPSRNLQNSESSAPKRIKPLTIQEIFAQQNLEFIQELSYDKLNNEDLTDFRKACSKESQNPRRRRQKYHKKLLKFIQEPPKTDLFEIQDTEKMGKGLFAKEEIAKGTLIGFYTGEVIRIADKEGTPIPNLDTTYAFGFSEPPMDRWAVDAKEKGNLLRYINEDQVQANLSIVEHFTEKGPYIVFMTNRKINKGEQFFLNYGEYYDRDYSI